MKLREVRPSDDDGSASFGTQDWQSFAAFLAGVEAHLSGNRPEAKRCYLEALDKDSTNVKAQLNLAVLRLYSDNLNERRLGLTKLRQIRRRLR